jgi:hypothetical protein
MTPHTNRRRAQVLAEFAVVLPLCLVMLAGIVDLGMLLQHHIALQTVLREGALVASRAGTTDDRIKAIMMALPGNLGLTSDEIHIQRRRGDAAFEKLDAGDGQVHELPGGSSRYEAVEIEIAAHHSYLMPGFFPGGSEAKVRSSIKTFQIVR